jgi:hypothetical protein
MEQRPGRGESAAGTWQPPSRPRTPSPPASVAAWMQVRACMYMRQRDAAEQDTAMGVMWLKRAVGLIKAAENRWPHLRPSPCRACDAKDEGASGGRLFAVQGQASQAHTAVGCVAAAAADEPPDCGSDGAAVMRVCAAGGEPFKERGHVRLAVRPDEDAAGRQRAVHAGSGRCAHSCPRHSAFWCHHRFPAKQGRASRAAAGAQRRKAASIRSHVLPRCHLHVFPPRCMCKRVCRCLLPTS